jgi:uncharacterized protein GlcG (DUF336 family)
MKQHPALELEDAKRMAAAARAEAERNEWHVVIAVSDEGGQLMYLERMDGAQRGSIRVAQDKAYCAAMFKRPTKVFGDAVADGKLAMLGLPGALPLAGGVHIVAEGHVVGAIGVSGVTAEQDAQIAAAGLAAL